MWADLRTPQVLAELGYPQLYFEDRVSSRPPTTAALEALGIPDDVSVIRQLRTVYTRNFTPPALVVTALHPVLQNPSKTPKNEGKPAMSQTLALTPDLDLTEPLRTANDAGVALVENALDVAFCEQLAEEVSSGPFEAMPTEAGRARQEGYIFRLRGHLENYPAVEQLGRDLVQQIHAQGGAVVGVSNWKPNEVDVQRYPVGALGITPHLDFKRYRILIAIITAAGSARFTLCKDRAGNPVNQWEVAAGDLMLLRAPGLGNHADGRPLHAVVGPRTGHRISVTWRMNSVV